MVSIAEASHEDQGNRLCPRHAFEAAASFEAVHLQHHGIHQHEVRPCDHSGHLRLPRLLGIGCEGYSHDAGCQHGRNWDCEFHFKSSRWCAFFCWYSWHSFKVWKYRTIQPIPPP